MVLQFCVVIAFSSSSSWPVFFSFFTRLFTAFSHHFSSWPFCSPPPAPLGPLVDFFQPKSLFTTGGVNGKMEDILAGQAGSLQRTQYTHRQEERGGPRATVWALGLMRAPLVMSKSQGGTGARWVCSTVEETLRKSHTQNTLLQKSWSSLIRNKTRPV